MPAAAAVADPGLNEFEVGGRWFACAPHVDPDLLIWTMHRAQAAPDNPHDPAASEWLSCVITFLLAATDERDHDALISTLTASVQQDADATVIQVAEVFQGLLAMFADAEMDETRARIVAHEQARAVTFPAREEPVVRYRSTVADIERINAKHRRKATGEVIDPGV